MQKILVIDDEQWLREMVHLALNQRGFHVLEADNGTAGIELARKELPDLILCDVNMEGLNGYLTLECLRNEPATAAIPFILMTGAADNAGMRQGMELGADDYLPKPFALTALFAAVEARLKKSQALRQEAEKKLADLRTNISLMLPHELRTPLNGILAYGEILGAEAATLQPTEIAEMGQVIYESGKRLERLIENFLIYAQLELLAADPQKIAGLRKAVASNSGRVIETQARAHARSAGREADLVVEVIDCQAPISENYLAKIVDELAQNAFKFSQAGSPIEVRLSELAHQLVLTIKDRGHGFSTEHITRIGAYMQFNRKVQEQQGQGLGLSIAKRLTEIHGGTLTIQTNPESGTLVTVRLPKIAAEELVSNEARTLFPA